MIVLKFEQTATLYWVTFYAKCGFYHPKLIMQTIKYTIAFYSWTPSQPGKPGSSPG